MLSKKTTDELIEDLAMAVKNGFEAVAQRFEAVDQRFDRLENELKAEIHEVRRDVSVLSNKVDELRSDLLMDSSQLDNHERRIKLLEKTA